MAKKVTVTLVDDFDGEGAADETVEFGLDGVSYEIDLSSKNASKLRNDLKQWVDAGRRVGGRRRGVRPDRAADGRRSIVNKAPQSANGHAATGTTCRPADASPPTSSMPSTRQHSRPLPECGPVVGCAVPAFASGELAAVSNWKRFRHSRRC